MQLKLKAEPQNRIEGARKFFVDLKFLSLEQLFIVRANWKLYLIFSAILPLVMVFGFGRIGNLTTNQNNLLFIISGSSIITVVNEGIVNMAARIGLIRMEGRLIYYASLPINKTAFILAMLCSRLVVNLGSMLIPIMLGPFFYNIKVDLNPWIIILLPLTVLSLTSLGVALGSFIREYDLIVMLGNLLLLIVTLASPVFTPKDDLPLPLQILGAILPPTYAADALRRALAGNITADFYFDLFILVLMTLVSLYIVNRFLRWRIE